MEFIQTLKDRFGENTPITIDEIKAVCGNYSRPRISQFIDEAINKKELVRYIPGVYYLPKETQWGPSVIDPMSVVRKKYIEDKGKRFGFFGGLTALNALGLSTQLPFTFEIISNNATARKRYVTVKRQKFLIRKARVAVDNRNYPTLLTLELANILDPETIASKQFISFIKENKITRGDIQKYSPFYPVEVSAKLIKSGVIYEFA